MSNNDTWQTLSEITIQEKSGNRTFQVKHLGDGGYSSVYEAKCTDKAYCDEFSVPWIVEKDANGNDTSHGVLAIRVNRVPVEEPDFEMGPPQPYGVCHARHAGAAELAGMPGEPKNVFNKAANFLKKHGIISGKPTYYSVGIAPRYDDSLANHLSSVDAKGKPNALLTEEQSGDLLAAIALGKHGIVQLNQNKGITEVAHLDIKPGNILVRKDAQGNLEFALSDYDTLTAVGESRGFVYTPGYTRNRDVHNGPATASMDAYSIAATIYEARTGTRLVHSYGKNSEEKQENIGKFTDLDSGARAIGNMKWGDSNFSDRLNWSEFATSEMLLNKDINNDKMMILAYIRCSDRVKAQFKPEHHLAMHKEIERMKENGEPSEIYEALYARAMDMDITANRNSPQYRHYMGVANQLNTTGFTAVQTQQMEAISDRHIAAIKESQKVNAEFYKKAYPKVDPKDADRVAANAIGIVTKNDGKHLVR